MKAEKYHNPLLEHGHVLPKEETEELIPAAQAGDLKAQDRLVRSLLLLVGKLAHKYAASEQDFHEYVACGLLGVKVAIDTFDATRGVQLTTHAGWWIRCEIFKFMRDNFRMVKIGTTQAQRKLFWRLNRERNRLGADVTDVTDKDLADTLDVSVRDVESMTARMAAPEVSFDQCSPETDRTLHETIGTEDPRDALDASLDASWIRARMDEYRGRLRPSERAIWDARIDAADPDPAWKVGALLQVSKQRIGQIERTIRDGFKRFCLSYDLRS